MKVGIMQPYFFPYLGYFQLIHAVDAFVLYDDVNYIKGGWVNRNYLLSQGRRQRMTLALAGASQNKRINQIELVGNNAKLLKTIRLNYAKAPHFASVFPLVEEILLQQERNLARFLDFSLRRICAHLGLRPEWHVSSERGNAAWLGGQDRILAICEALQANHYVNLPGGRDLYDHQTFTERGMQLSFIEMKAVVYRQLGSLFVPGLSILDVIMFNDTAQCSRLLREYRLV